MGCGAYLRELLRPLGVYDWSEGSIQLCELESMGAALDLCMEELERVGREMLLPTAEGDGLTAVETLLAYRPVSGDTADRRAALAALLRIGGDSFTPAAIHDNLLGCGLRVKVEETEQRDVVAVSFPDVVGVPEGFEEMRRIIEAIIPCHLDICYVYWFIKWYQMEEKFSIWGEIEAENYTWDQLEKLVW